MPIPSSAISISSQALSDPVPTPSDTSRPGILRNDEQGSTSSHPVDPQEPNEVNNEYLAHLLDLGFDEYTAVLALKRTNSAGVEQVPFISLCFALEHINFNYVNNTHEIMFHVY